MSIKDAICEAIGQRRLVSFIYKSAQRTAEPYILGYDDKGALTLSAYQTSGGSGTGFRTFLVDGMSFVTMTERGFTGTRPEYNPRDRYFAHIVCQV
ncbi:MAG: WYL domain-containing protein [Pseudaminobacter sp.]